jgi:hypothetical protein
LIELFFEAGWDLIVHAYPAFTFDRSKPSLEAMGTTDGDLFLRNARLIESV